MKTLPFAIKEDEPEARCIGFTASYEYDDVFGIWNRTYFRNVYSASEAKRLVKKYKEKARRYRIIVERTDREDFSEFVLPIAIAWPFNHEVVGMMMASSVSDNDDRFVILDVYLRKEAGGYGYMDVVGLYI